MIRKIKHALCARVNRAYGRVKLKARFREGEAGMLFIIGHMRTGSTLLVHILCNNPEIIGYGETHYAYSKQSDIYASALKIYEKMGSKPKGRYALDKVIHQGLIKDDRVIHHPAVQVIFLIRSPAESLSSMLEAEVVPSPEGAVEHYIRQLTWVSRLTSQVEYESTAFLTYDNIVHKTDEVLDGLGEFLDLKKPLRSEYNTMESTDVYGIGDPGPHIHAEEVKKDIDRTLDPRVEPYLTETRSLFNDCLENLRKSCIQVAS